MKKYPTPFVMLLSGVPMSGKSTWIKDNYPDTIVISRDNILMEVMNTKDYDKAFFEADQKIIDKKLNEKLKIAGKLKQNVILDMTNISVKTRARNLSFFSEDFYKIAIVFPILTSDEYKKRNEFRRINENKSIPTSVLNNMINSFTIPSYKEGFDEIIKL